MKLNNKQRTVLVVGVVVFALAATFFVPYEIVEKNGARFALPSSSIFQPSVYKHYTGTVVTKQYVIQLGTIAVIFGVLAFALKD